MFNSSWLDLVRMLGIPDVFSPKTSIEESMEFLDIAFNNRIAFLYLKELSDRGNLDALSIEFARHQRRHLNLHSDVARLERSLEKEKIDYVFLKTLREFPANPNDIDLILLGNGDDEEKAIQTLEKLGYNKYETTLGGIRSFRDPRRTNVNYKNGELTQYLDLDLYSEITVHGLIFFDKVLFRDAIETRVFTNVIDDSITEARVLALWMDLFFIYLHSIFPNRSYGLELLYTTVYQTIQFSEQDIKTFTSLCHSLRIENEIGCILKLSSELLYLALGERADNLEHLCERLPTSWRWYQLELQERKLPLIFPLRFFLGTGLKSTIYHKKGRRSIMSELGRMLNPLYTVEIMKDLVSITRARKRHSLKY